MILQETKLKTKEKSSQEQNQEFKEYLHFVLVVM